MVISMKIIAVAFDQETDEDLSISVIELFGYVLNPASVIFGPFVTIHQYRLLFSKSKIVSYFSVSNHVIFLAQQVFLSFRF